MSFAGRPNGPPPGRKSIRSTFHDQNQAKQQPVPQTRAVFRTSSNHTPDEAAPSPSLSTRQLNQSLSSQQTTQQQPQSSPLQRSSSLQTPFIATPTQTPTSSRQSPLLSSTPSATLLVNNDIIRNESPLPQLLPNNPLPEAISTPSSSTVSFSIPSPVESPTSSPPAPSSPQNSLPKPPTPQKRIPIKPSAPPTPSSTLLQPHHQLESLPSPTIAIESPTFRPASQNPSDLPPSRPLSASPSVKSPRAVPTRSSQNHLPQHDQMNNASKPEVLFFSVVKWLLHFRYLVFRLFYSIYHVIWVYLAKFSKYTPEWILYLVSQTFLLLFLGFQLLSALRHSLQWAIMAFRLITMATMVLPMWLVLVFRYVCLKQVHHGVRYGKNARNFADVYLPKDCAVEFHKRKQAMKRHQITGKDNGLEYAELILQLDIAATTSKLRQHLGCEPAFEVAPVTVNINNNLIPIASLKQQLGNIHLGPDFGMKNDDLTDTPDQIIDDLNTDQTPILDTPHAKESELISDFTTSDVSQRYSGHYHSSHGEDNLFPHPNNNAIHDNHHTSLLTSQDSRKFNQYTTTANNHTNNHQIYTSQFSQGGSNYDRNSLYDRDRDRDRDRLSFGYNSNYDEHQYHQDQDRDYNMINDDFIDVDLDIHNFTTDLHHILGGQSKLYPHDTLSQQQSQVSHYRYQHSNHYQSLQQQQQQQQNSNNESYFPPPNHFPPSNGTTTTTTTTTPSTPVSVNPNSHIPLPPPFNLPSPQPSHQHSQLQSPRPNLPLPYHHPTSYSHHLHSATPSTDRGSQGNITHVTDNSSQPRRQNSTHQVPLLPPLIHNDQHSVQFSRFELASLASDPSHHERFDQASHFQAPSTDLQNTTSPSPFLQTHTLYPPHRPAQPDSRHNELDGDYSSFRTNTYDGAYDETIVISKNAFQKLNSSHGTSILTREPPQSLIQQKKSIQHNFATSGMQALPPLPVSKPKITLVFFAGGAWIISHRLWGSFLLSTMMNLTVKKRVYSKLSQESQSVYAYIGYQIYSTILAMILWCCATFIDLNTVRTPEIDRKTENTSNQNDNDDSSLAGLKTEQERNFVNSLSRLNKGMSSDNGIMSQINDALDHFLLEDCCNGILCMAVDYRNFPQGDIYDMITDFTNGIQWALKSAPLYGGDPSTVFVMGQSAAAHILILSALQAYANLKRFHQEQLQLCTTNDDDFERISKKLENTTNEFVFGPEIVQRSPYQQTQGVFPPSGLNHNNSFNSNSGNNFSGSTNTTSSSSDSNSDSDSSHPESLTISPLHSHNSKLDTHEIVDSPPNTQSTLSTPSSSTTTLEKKNTEVEKKSQQRLAKIAGLASLEYLWLLKVAGIILLSGPYNLLHAKDTFYKNGLSPNVLDLIMVAYTEEHLYDVSPCHIAAKLFGFDAFVDSLNAEIAKEEETRIGSSLPLTTTPQTSPVIINTSSVLPLTSTNSNSELNSNHASKASLQKLNNKVASMIASPSSPHLQLPAAATMTPTTFSGKLMSEYEIDLFRSQVYSNVDHLATTPHLVPSMVFPPCFILHGSNDKTTDVLGSFQLFHLLRSCGHIRAYCDIFLGISHTDMIIELCATGSDPLVAHLQHIFNFSLLKRHISRLEFEQGDQTHTSQLHMLAESINPHIPIDQLTTTFPNSTTPTTAMQISPFDPHPASHTVIEDVSTAHTTLSPLVSASPLFSSHLPPSHPQSSDECYQLSNLIDIDFNISCIDPAAHSHNDKTPVLSRVASPNASFRKVDSSNKLSSLSSISSSPSFTRHTSHHSHNDDLHLPPISQIEQLFLPAGIPANLSTGSESSDLLHNRFQPHPTSLTLHPALFPPNIPPPPQRQNSLSLIDSNKHKLIHVSHHQHCPYVTTHLNENVPCSQTQPPSDQTIFFCDCNGIQYIDGDQILQHSVITFRLVPQWLVSLARRINPF